MAINARQQRFIESYLFFENATQAAKDAGYSEKTAGSIGHDLLKVPEIKLAIDAGRAKKMEKSGLTAEMLLLEIMNIAFCDITLAYNKDGSPKKPHEIPADVRKAMASIEFGERFGKDGEVISQSHRYKFWEKTKATDQLGRYLKLFTDKLEVDDKSSLAERLNRFKAKAKS